MSLNVMMFWESGNGNEIYVDVRHIFYSMIHNKLR